LYLVYLTLNIIFSVVGTDKFSHGLGLHVGIFK
jgi:hypothetical protein